MRLEKDENIDSTWRTTNSSPMPLDSRRLSADGGSSQSDLVSNLTSFGPRSAFISMSGAAMPLASMLSNDERADISVRGHWIRGSRTG